MKNHYEYIDDCYAIHYKDKLILLDECDLSLVDSYSSWWTIHSNGHDYAVTKVDGKRLWMQKVILGVECKVDHVNNHGLDNRRRNLRVATASQNAGNTGLCSSNTSGYRGVWLHSPSGRWQSGLRIGRERIYLGSFPDSESAALAYNEAAKAHFGEFAYLNMVGV